MCKIKLLLKYQQIWRKSNKIVQFDSNFTIFDSENIRKFNDIAIKALRNSTLRYNLVLRAYLILQKVHPYALIQDSATIRTLRVYKWVAKWHQVGWWEIEF